MVPGYEVSRGGAMCASAASAHATPAGAALAMHRATAVARRAGKGTCEGRDDFDIWRFQNSFGDGNIAALHSPVRVPHGANRSAIVRPAPSSVAAAFPAVRRPAARPGSCGNLLFSHKNIGDKTLSVDESLKTRIEELVRAGAVRRKLAAAQLEAEIRRREEVLRRTFRRYLSPRLADKILEDAQLRD